MSTPNPIDATLSSFTPEQQAAIKALIAQAAAANQPAPPKELTPAEQVEVHLAAARAALQHAGNTTSIFDRILTILEVIAEKVFAAAAEAAASGVVGAVSGTANYTTNQAIPASVITSDTSSASAGSAV